MISNTFFNMSRFVHLCRKEMVENWKVNLNRAIMMYGIFTIILVWNGYFQYSNPTHLLSMGNISDPIWEFSLGMYQFALFILGCLSASYVMENFKTKTQRISVLMTPATMFEKFFSRWSIYTFGFIIMFLIAFKLADWTRMAIYLISKPELKDIISATPLTRFAGNDGGYSIFTDCYTLLLSVGCYLFAQSLFVLGSSIWPKNSFVKSFTAIVIVAIVYAMITGGFVSVLFNDITFSGNINIGTSDGEGSIMPTIIISAMAIFNWTVAYFRFKESEIINRW